MKPSPTAEFVPWSAVRFQTEAARDQFLNNVAMQPMDEVEGAPMPGQSHAAVVRWRPGKFLALNDVAYAHGGRIIVSSGRTRRG